MNSKTNFDFEKCCFFYEKEFFGAPALEIKKLKMGAILINSRSLIRDKNDTSKKVSEYFRETLGG